MSKIVIDRPPSPLPPLASPARKWVPKAEWAKRAAERDQEKAKEADKPLWSAFLHLMGREY